LILDIFAAHAKTAEGKLQVEMAQQKYRLSRLTGLGKSLSRLGGGIGTRGPGETKLETDRRVIASRLTRLSAQIEELAKNRENTRKKRKEQGLPQVALVGYTNAGKSTWLNCLTKTEAKVLTADMLFATLDPATRRAVLPNGREVLVTDTVGFIHKLPHQLIDAFKSTLEEAAYADILIHVVDCSDPFFPDKMEVVYKTLAELSLSDKPVITVFNKADRIPELQSSLLPFKMHDEKAMAVVTGSAKTGEGTEKIFAAIESYYREHQIYYEGLISYDDTRIIEQIRRQGELLSEDYQPEGIYITAYLPPYFHLT
jgi:GTP-binding protein HflX